MSDKIPILLHHGLFGVGEIKLGPIALKSFPGIDRAIIDRGHPLIVSRVHPAASVATRARQLKEVLVQHLETRPKSDRKVIIIAHSMGGLDARYLISHLGMAEHVPALLTITTPHRGSPYADWCLRHIGKRLRGLQLARLLHLDINALPDLTTEACAAFNEKTPNHPAVKYFSISGSRPRDKIPPWALHSHKIIFDIDGDNDGLVSVKSAKHGTHLTTWTADHWQAINKRAPIFHKNDIGDITPHYLSAIDQVLDAL